jgi:hypothetical protein
LNLKIKGVEFVANLIVLDSKGIDIILGTNWLSKHKVPIDVLRSPYSLPPQDRNELEYVVELVVTAKGAAKRVKLNLLMPIKDPRCQ